ncbi:MAG: hypothetical protein FJ109_11805 [Deltaproteobacteria bacterium]|nr:hypothetical protein [Deltaproteobacteria bacterium]
MSRYGTDDSIPDLRAALYGKNNDDLKKLAALTRQKVAGRKDDLVATIMRHLDGEGLRTAWQGLDHLQRAAVAEVVHSDSTRFNHDMFRAKYGRGPNWGDEDQYGYRRRPSALCLFFFGNVMPDDIKARLKAFVPQPAKTEVKTLAELPATYDIPYTVRNYKANTTEEKHETVPLTLRESEGAAQRELLSVLRLVDSGKISVSDKTRRASAASVEMITAILEGGDYYPRLPSKNRWHDENAGPIRAFAWPLIIQAGGLAQLSGSKLQLTKTGRKALSEPPSETIRTLWSRWIDSTILDELSRIECIKGQTGRGGRGLTAVSSRRDAIVETLEECPAGAWIAADELLRFLRATGTDLSVTRNAWGLYISDQQYGSLGHMGAEDIVDRRYFLAFLLEYAATLGLIDVALIPPAGARHDYGGLWGTDDLVYFSRYDGLIYLRITRLGAYCLGTDSSYQAPPVEVRAVLRVLPNLDVAAIGSDLQQGDRLALDAYSVRVSELVWRLDAGKLLIAVEEGRPVDEVREFLASRSSTPIPDTVLRLLADVANRVTKVRDRGLARLVECADEALAALIAHDTRTRRFCMRAGDRFLAVPSSSEAAFKRTLREIGYLVAAQDAVRARQRRADEPDSESSPPTKGVES